MLIDREKCIGCMKCIPFCPMEAIVSENKKASVNSDRCTECGVCKGSNLPG